MQFVGYSCVTDAKVAYFCLYYARIMTLICFILKTSLHAKDNMMVDMLSIDGVMPSKESLRNKKYPFVSSIYAAVRKTEDHESMAYKLYQFLFTKKK